MRSRHEAYPHEVPINAVASPRTLDALRRDTHTDIEPLKGTSPGESVEELRGLVAVFRCAVRVSSSDASLRVSVLVGERGGI